ncbi:MAG: tetratricopeptide repeat protein [Pseudomonadota bacterium]
MTAWLIIVALAVLSFVVGALILRMPREGWTLFAAVLVFGLAGYAWQGSPGQASSPKAQEVRAQQSGQEVVEARLQLFEDAVPKPAYLVTSDGFARQGQFGDAAQLLRRGMVDNPNHLEGWLALGNALVGHADGFVTPAAREAFDRANAIDPVNPSASFFLGFAYLRSGEIREARAVWGELLDRAPEDADWRPGLEQRVAALDAMIANAPMLQGR